MAKGRTDIYQIGIDPGNSNQKLPALEDMAEHFRDLASKFEIIHPLTGEVLNLQNETASSILEDLQEKSVHP